MRLKAEQIDFIKKSIFKYLPSSSIYLFGSRVDDNKKGGDIDILVIGKDILTNEEKRNIKISYFKKFGLQKLDIVCFIEDEPSSFKELALFEAERL